MTDPKALHDRDWLGAKASDSFYVESPRYPDIAGVIAGLAPKRLLDVGCGSGYLASLVRAERPEIHMDGADISDVALKRAEKYFERVWQVNLDEAQLPAESVSYDTAVCTEVLEHLYDPAHALAEIHRCLVPGGKLVVTVPNMLFWRYRLELLGGGVPDAISDPRHLHVFTPELLGSLLSKSGFQVERILGHGVRFRKLARTWPGLFSDVLITVAVKKQG